MEAELRYYSRLSLTAKKKEYNKKHTDVKQVIAIGALGGSGTRAIAQVLIDAGVYMGDNLNSANDNLIFTRLFKDPSFYECATKKMIRERLSVFDEYMKKDHLSWENAKILVGASFSNPMVRNRVKFHARVLSKMFSKRQDRLIWGWKEPNTQIYLQEIDDHFESLKYLHVVRHGLDMAFSRNKKQVANWGYRYGIHISKNDTTSEIAYKQLEYWMQSTREAINKGKSLRGCFLLVNHTKFCNRSEEQIDRILNFIEVEVEPEKRKALYHIPQMPRTEGRFRKHDLGIFDQAQIDFVRQMGFDV